MPGNSIDGLPQGTAPGYYVQDGGTPYIPNIAPLPVQNQHFHPNTNAVPNPNFNQFPQPQLLFSGPYHPTMYNSPGYPPNYQCGPQQFTQFVPQPPPQQFYPMIPSTAMPPPQCQNPPTSGTQDSGTLNRTGNDSASGLPMDPGMNSIPGYHVNGQPMVNGSGYYPQQGGNYYLVYPNGLPQPMQNQSVPPSCNVEMVSQFSQISHPQQAYYEPYPPPINQSTSYSQSNQYGQQPPHQSTQFVPQPPPVHHEPMKSVLEPLQDHNPQISEPAHVSTQSTSSDMRETKLQKHAGRTEGLQKIQLEVWVPHWEYSDVKSMNYLPPLKELTNNVNKLKSSEKQKSVSNVLEVSGLKSMNFISPVEKDTSNSTSLQSDAPKLERDEQRTTSSLSLVGKDKNDSAKDEGVFRDPLSIDSDLVQKDAGGSEEMIEPGIMSPRQVLSTSGNNQAELATLPQDVQSVVVCEEHPTKIKSKLTPPKRIEANMPSKRNFVWTTPKKTGGNKWNKAAEAYKDGFTIVPPTFVEMKISPAQTVMNTKHHQTKKSEGAKQKHAGSGQLSRKASPVSPKNSTLTLITFVKEGTDKLNNLDNTDVVEAVVETIESSSKHDDSEENMPNQANGISVSNGEVYVSNEAQKMKEKKENKKEKNKKKKSKQKGKNKINAKAKKEDEELLVEEESIPREAESCAEPETSTEPEKREEFDAEPENLEHSSNTLVIDPENMVYPVNPLALECPDEAVVPPTFVESNKEQKKQIKEETREAASVARKTEVRTLITVVEEGTDKLNNSDNTDVVEAVVETVHRFLEHDDCEENMPDQAIGISVSNGEVSVGNEEDDGENGTQKMKEKKENNKEKNKKKKEKKKENIKKKKEEEKKMKTAEKNAETVKQYFENMSYTRIGYLMLNCKTTPEPIYEGMEKEIFDFSKGKPPVFLKEETIKVQDYLNSRITFYSAHNEKLCSMFTSLHSYIEEIEGDDKIKIIKIPDVIMQDALYLLDQISKSNSIQEELECKYMEMVENYARKDEPEQFLLGFDDLDTWYEKIRGNYLDNFKTYITCQMMIRHVLEREIFSNLSEVELALCQNHRKANWTEEMLQPDNTVTFLKSRVATWYRKEKTEDIEMFIKFYHLLIWFNSRCVDYDAAMFQQTGVVPLEVAHVPELKDERAFFKLLFGYKCESFE